MRQQDIYCQSHLRCFGAASAKNRLDVVIRDAINAGDFPRLGNLANGKEMARRNGELVTGITAFADGPDEMRKVSRHHMDIGVDNIKLSMFGEEVSHCMNPYVYDGIDKLLQIIEVRSAQDCYLNVDRGQSFGRHHYSA